VLASGTFGDAALGLAAGAPAALARRQRRPVPRLDLGRALAGIASAAIDVSDGLVQDLGHICEASRVGAALQISALPLSPAYQRAVRARADPWAPALAGGEDYELLVTVPRHRVARALRAARRAETPLAVVGEIVAGEGVRIVAPDGALLPPPRGHDHLAPLGVHRRRP
jgi:thiamine-monophosphate kinase